MHSIYSVFSIVIFTTIAITTITSTIITTITITITTISLKHSQPVLNQYQPPAVTKHIFFTPSLLYSIQTSQLQSSFIQSVFSSSYPVFLAHCQPDSLNHQPPAAIQLHSPTTSLLGSLTFD